MKIGIAADHGGWKLKEFLKAHFAATAYHVTDFGALEWVPSDDYPDYVVVLAEAVAERSVERGIAICGSGVGACIAANKVAGARAALIMDTFSARQGVEDDDMNIICLGARVIGEELAWELSWSFLAARFQGSERHLRRLGKIAALEESKMRST